MVRATLRAKAHKAVHSARPTPTTTTTKPHPAHPPTQLTKRDKRTTRHAALLARVAASAITKSSKKNLKRKESRSAKQNLITGLSSLADALPDAGDEDEWEDWEHNVFDQSSKDAMRSLQQKKKEEQEGKIRMKSIKSKPGAQKRKEKVRREECARFGKNLAIINSAAKPEAGEGGNDGHEAEEAKVPAVSSWAALRGFIANTIEKKEEFAQMEAGEMDLDG